MGSQGKKWIVRDGKGHIYGPFDYVKMQELVRRGLITGEEQAAHYPAGDWAPMSADKDLYELVLAALADPVTRAAPRRAKTQNENEQDLSDELDMKTPVSVNTGSNGDSLKSAKSVNSTNTGDEPSTVIQFPGEKTSGTKTKKTSAGTKTGQRPLSQTSPTIELKEKTKIVRRGRFLANLLPLSLIVGAGFLFYVGNKYSGNGSRPLETINLIMPHLKKTANPTLSETLVKRGWNYFYKDTYLNYVQAEEAFVGAVENNSQNTEALLMLVYTDLQLWPFTRQDSSDQNTVQSLVQLLSQEDRYGSKRPVASAAADIMFGRDANARNQINSALQSSPAEGRLYALEGQILYEGNQIQSAMGYFEKAVTLLPYWVHPVYMMGMCLSRMGDGAGAQKYLIQALKMNPSHAGARLEMGIIEAKYYNHESKAREYLTVALENDEKLMPLDESRGRYILGLLLEKAGDRAGARKQAQEALQLNPSDPDIKDLLNRVGGSIPKGEWVGADRQHMVVGDQYMRAGNYLGAQGQFKAAFIANPKNARAAMKAAEALWKLHQTTEAVEYLQKSIRADPKFTESYVVLADYRSQRFEFDEAARALEQAMKVNPRNYEIFRGYGDLFLRRGDLSSAEKYANKALNLYEIDVPTNILMSKVQLAKKDVVKALEFGKRAVDLDKGDPDAQVNYAKVTAAYEGVKNAVAYLNDLINTYPTQLAYRVGLGELLLQDEQYSEATQVLSQVVAADQNNKEAYLLMGDAQAQSGRLDDALGSYLSAARVDPSDPTALFRSGEVYLKANKPDKAKEQFALVLKVNPMFPRTHYNLARADFAMGDTAGAIQDLEEEKKLNPGLADPYEFEGDLLLATRKYQQATKEYEKASEIKKSAAIYVKMAKAYRGQGAFDAALAMLRLASQRESGLSEIYKEMGYVFEAKGMQSEAATAFQKYLTLEPNAADKQVIQAKINQLQ